jgi:hypothetical protein
VEIAASSPVDEEMIVDILFVTCVAELMHALK